MIQSAQELVNTSILKASKIALVLQKRAGAFFLIYLFIARNCIVCCNSPAGMSYVARIEQKEKRTEPQEKALRAPEWQAADQTECQLHLSSPESRYYELTATIGGILIVSKAAGGRKRKKAVYFAQIMLGRSVEG